MFTIEIIFLGFLWACSLKLKWLHPLLSHIRVAHRPEKCLLYPVYELINLQDRVNILGGKIGVTNYLFGYMPLGAKKCIWNEVENEKKLANWRSQSLSLGGRGHSVNIVLDALPSTYLHGVPFSSSCECSRQTMLYMARSTQV